MVVQTVFLGQPPSAACAFYTDFQDAIVLPHSDRYHSYCDIHKNANEHCVHIFL